MYSNNTINIIKNNNRVLSVISSLGLSMPFIIITFFFTLAQGNPEDVGTVQDIIIDTSMLALPLSFIGLALLTFNFSCINISKFVCKFRNNKWSPEFILLKLNDAKDSENDELHMLIITSMRKIILQKIYSLITIIYAIGLIIYFTQA